MYRVGSAYVRTSNLLYVRIIKSGAGWLLNHKSNAATTQARSQARRAAAAQLNVSSALPTTQLSPAFNNQPP